MKTVNILGTPYTIKHVDDGQDEYMEKMSFGGYCNGLDKEIVILNLKSTDEWKNDPEAAIKKQEDETMRHEIIHAFLNESGLQWSSFVPDKAWAKNEEMVDWFALQFPKILMAFKEADCI
jgi:hypothetical protein